MESDSQIQALLKKIEAEEMEVMLQRKSIEQVLETREKDFRSLERSVQERKLKLEKLRGSGRMNAAREKDLNQLSTGLAFAQRLKKELEQDAPRLEEKRVDYQRANDRLQNIEGELKRIQLERKKLEKLLANRIHAGRVMQEAREEASMDEMTRLSRRGRDRE